MAASARIEGCSSVNTSEALHHPTGADVVAGWRLEVLQRAFTSMFALLAAILLVESGLSLRSGQWHALPALALAVAFQAIAAFARSASVGARAVAFVAAACVGLGMSLPVLGFAFPIPFIVAMMTLTLLALCVGQRFALTSLLVLLVIVLFDASYVCFLRAEPLPASLAVTQRVLDPNSFANWIRVSSVFAAVAVATIVSVGYLVHRLEEAVRHNGTLFGSLEQVSRERIRALEERTILQDKVSRANELQLLGLLSATVAHDFNNLLMVILGNASALEAEVQGRAREDVADIVSAGEQAAELCRRLLTLARERISGDEIVDLNRVVEAELPILRRLVTARVKVDWEPGPALWVKCARTEMRQALLNLSANARDAMPRGGRLRLSTASVQRPPPGKEEPSHFACLTIGDDGVGMDGLTRDRIFEPFFTTKDATKGTGLGMSVVSAAVERHQGFLELATELGKGTTFSLFFPLVEAPARDLVPPSSGARSELRGTETVLIVDDDEGARKMLARYLQKHGYTLHTANDGEEALELIARLDKIDLVVSDAVMPKLGGRALFEAVTKERPELPFLFCSGFPAGTIPADFLDAPHRDLLSKPFSEEALLEKVRQLLDGGRGK
jgi:signal transduction histidine kinase